MKRSRICIIGSSIMLICASILAGEEPIRLGEILTQADAASVSDHLEIRNELLGVLSDVDDSLLKKLLKIDQDIASTWSDFAQGQDQGLTKLVRHGLLGWTTRRGHGAFYSFTTKEHSDRIPQLVLQQMFTFSSQFTSSDMGVVMVLPVEHLDDVELKTCQNELMADYADPVIALAKLNSKLAPPTPAAAVGTVYAVRSARYGEADLLVAFEVVAKDQYTVTLAWKVLKQYPVPVRR